MANLENANKCKRCGEHFVESNTEIAEFKGFCQSCCDSIPVSLFQKEANSSLTENYQKIADESNFDDKIVNCEICNSFFILTKQAQEFDANHGILCRPNLCGNCIEKLDELRNQALEDLGLHLNNYSVHNEIAQKMIESCDNEKMIPWVNINVKALIMKQIENAYQKNDSIAQPTEIFWRNGVEHWSSAEDECCICSDKFNATAIKRMSYHALNEYRALTCEHCDKATAMFDIDF